MSTTASQFNFRGDTPRAVITILGLYSLVGGLTSFYGWVADLRRLTDWINTGISIQPNATVAAMCSGVALLALARGYRPVVAVLGSIVALIGASALVQYLLDENFVRLNTALMFGREWGRVGVVYPGRMGPPGSASWTLIGTALVLTSRASPRARRLAPRIGLVAFAIATLSMAGYLYDADRLYSLPFLTVIAFQTATFIAAVSLGLIAAVPDRPPARWLLDTGAAGAVARRAVPLIILVPLAAGYLGLLGQDAGFYDTRFGVAILVIFLIILLFVLLSWTLQTIAQHEFAMQASERRVTAALESITDGFVTLDAEWRFRFVNAEAAALMQKSVAELLGTSAWDVFPESAGGASFRELHRASAERISVEYEEFNPLLQRWFANRAYPTSDGSIAVYFQDVTARKLIEAEREAETAGLARLQGLSTQLVQSGDFDVLLRELLSAAADLTGTTKGNIQFADHVTGQLRIHVHQGFGAAFLDYFAEKGSPFGCDRAARNLERVVCEDLMSAPEWQNSEDLRVLLAEGVRAFQSTPLVSRGGRLLGMLNTHFEEPHRLKERELRHLDLLARMAADFIERSQTEAALKNADRTKDEFLAMLAHELRNPLAPIMNAVRVLRLSNGNAGTLRSATDMLERQAAHLVRLVDDLVDISRITHGKIELARGPVDLTAVLRQALEAARPLMDAKNQHLDYVAPSAPVYVEGDFTRLTQVMGNLLSNASKFTAPAGRISVGVRCEGSGEVAIQVRDQGVGIPPDQLPRIFDLFMQGDTSLERVTSGLGIGLTLVKTLVEMHGGTVQALSDGPGMGSEFTIRLPTVAAPPRVSAAPAADAETAAKRLILVADDNEDGAASLATVLTLAGHSAHTARDGVEAVELAERLCPDVVLLDIGMPKLNGYEACQRIRQTPWGKDMFLIALTGWGQEAFRLRSTEAGFDAHVVKPVDSAALMRLLSRAERAVRREQAGNDGEPRRTRDRVR